MLRTIVYVFYVLVILFLVRLVSRTLGAVFGPVTDARRPGGRGHSSTRAPEDLVRDRICNTYVPRSRALTAVVEGREEHFCSERCREKARASVPRAS